MKFISSEDLELFFKAALLLFLSLTFKISVCGDMPEETFSNLKSSLDAKQYDEAMGLCEKIVGEKRTQEEIWYAKYTMGNIQHFRGDWDKALQYYLDAYESYPLRAEPLEKISKYYRLKKQNDLAYIFAAQGKKIPCPESQELSIDESVYNYRFDEELSVVAYYTQFKDEGYAAAEKLLFNKKTPPLVKCNTERNLRFYVKSLEALRFQPLSISPPLIREGAEFRYQPMNPSILKTSEGYQVICRCVNYTQKGGKNHQIIDQKKGDVFRTRNYLLDYDKDFNLISQKEVIDDISQPMKYCPYTPIEGFEDSRLFNYDNSLWVTCTVMDMNPYHAPQIGLYRLGDPIANDQHVSMELFIPLQSPNPKQCEKNWLPFVKDGKMHVLYSCDPFVIYQIDPKTGSVDPVLRKEQEEDFSSFRGSAGPIPFDDGYLVVIHQVATDTERYYFHRFLFLDNEYNITRISPLFTYKGAQVEYCCGMTLDYSGANLVMTVGIEDREALFAFLDVDAVRKLLGEKK